MTSRDPVLVARSCRVSLRTGGGASFELGDIDLDVRRGELLAVVGRSGSGKSTLLQLLGLLSPPTSGSIELEGRDMARVSDNELAAARRAHIGFVFQGFHLLPQLTALQNVALASGSIGASARRKATAQLEAVGLGDRLHHRPSELSGGQQQRVAVARALLNDPTIVLADEPTGNLDHDNERALLAQFREQADRGRAVVIVTHSSEVAAVADRVLVLDEGRIVTADSEVAR